MLTQSVRARQRAARAASATAVGLTMKLVGKPDAGNRHHRHSAARARAFDGGSRLEATGPDLASTAARTATAAKARGKQKPNRANHARQRAAMVRFKGRV